MIDFSQFHFLRPEWFLALIPLLVLYFALRKMHLSQSGWQGVLAGHLYKHLVTSKIQKGKRPPLFLLALGWFVAVTALAGPTWEQLPQPVYQLNTGKVVLIDMSLSMRATDIKPDRLTRAKFKGIDLIQQIDEGDVGLVAYAGDAFTISPLSSDSQNLTTLLPSLSPEIMPVAGSEPYLGLKSATDLLKNAGYFEGDIFWITDGVEMSQLAELNEFISKSPYRISILGVGTADGAPIQLVDGDFLKDASGAIVIPKMDETKLSGLAARSGGRFVRIRSNDTDIEYLVDQSLTSSETTQDDTQEDKFGDQWKEAGPYLLLLLLPIAAFSFRRGYMFIVCIVLGSGLMTPQPAYAFQWQNWFKNDDQKGSETFAKGDYSQAAEQFNDPMWKGSALYRNGDYEAALQHFAKVDGVEGLYNSGNALAKLGELQKAIEAYDAVLNEQPDHEDAKQNKALLEKLLEEQEQQQDQQSQDQQSQDQESQEQSSESQDQQDQSQSDQNQQQSDSQEQNDQTQSQNEQESEQQEQQSPSQNSEQQNEEQEESAEEQQNQAEPEQQNEQQSEAAQQSEQPLTDEEREQMQRMQNLLNRVPDDPAFLLKRKMMLENQQRRQERLPNRTRRSW